jgi:hypothetical protein
VTALFHLNVARQVVLIDLLIDPQVIRDKSTSLARESSTKEVLIGTKALKRIDEL